MKRVTLIHPDLAEPANVACAARGRDGDEAYAVTIGERTFNVRIQRSGGGCSVLRRDDEVFPYYAARRENRLHLWIGGRTYAFEIADATRRARPAVASGVLADLTAPMPGTVRAIRVSAGDAFAAHDPLVILESMKMEMTLSAPAGGRVGAVCCAVGDLVDMGAVLLELEGEGDAGSAS
ncbi:MAG: hypothetical protein H6816_11620 [Phycisphaerales bacterium]|nr:hypothetical protein [Phycisphaerales bacterium]